MMLQPLIPITRRQSIFFILFFLLYEFLTYIANDMIMPGMIKVVESFHGSEAAIANSLTAYLLGGASLQLILGPLSDRYGRRPVMIFGATLFFLCTVAIGASNSMDQFMAARFFQGMGLCFIGVVGYASIQETFAEMDAVRLVSLMASLSLVAPLIGPLLGALCIYYYSWRWIFVGIGILSLIALWGLIRYMPETVGQVKRDGESIERIDLQPRVIITHYMTLLRHGSFMKGSLALGFQLLPCMIWIALSPIILVKQAHLSIIAYGLWQLPVFGACILGTIALRVMTHQRSLIELVNIGSLIVMTGILMLFILPFLFGNHYLWLMPGMILYFFGMGFGHAPLYRHVLFSTPVMKGMASALISMIDMCIQAIGLAIVNVFYASHRNRILSFSCLVIGLLFLSMVRTVRSEGGKQS